MPPIARTSAIRRKADRGKTFHKIQLTRRGSAHPLGAMQLKWHLSHLRGYLELGMVAEAMAELDQIPAEHADRTEVLEMRVLILQELRDWTKASAAAEELCRRDPSNIGAWVSYAYATRRAKTLPEAEAILLVAQARHPQSGIVCFNLACYACQRGDLKLAEERLARAVALDPQFKALSQTDPDLAPLRRTRN